MAELTEAIEAANLSPLGLLLLLQDYGQAHAAQYRRPSDEGNKALGDAARAIYAYTDAREAATRREIAEEIRALICCTPENRCCCCDDLDQAAAAIARGRGETGGGHASNGPESHAAGIEPNIGGAGKGDGLGGPQCACPRIAVHGVGEQPRYVLGLAPWGCEEHHGRGHAS